MARITPLACGLCSVWALHAGVAHADACSDAYVGAQRAEKKGQLLESRRLLEACLAPECADYMRTDCATWLERVGRAIPRAVFRAKTTEGEDLVRVEVKLGDRTLQEGLDGKAVELDPGAHELTFTYQGESKTKRIVLSEGSGARVVEVTFGSEEPQTQTQPDAPSTPAKGPLDTGATTESSSNTLAWALFATAGAGLLGFVGLGLLATTQRDDAQRRCNDSGACDDSAFKRTSLFADIALGVGVAAAGAGTYFLIAPITNDSGEQPTTVGWVLGAHGSF